MSILNVHDIRNYTSVKTDWEVQGRQGCCWVNLGIYSCVGDLTACRKAHKLYLQHIRMRVRYAPTVGVDAGTWRRVKFAK